MMVVCCCIARHIGPSSAMLCSQAKEHGLWLVGGSIPEKHIVEESEEPEIYNTVRALTLLYCIVFRA
jgi:hypothetical protein